MPYRGAVLDTKTNRALGVIGKEKHLFHIPYARSNFIPFGKLHYGQLDKSRITSLLFHQHTIRRISRPWVGGPGGVEKRLECPFGFVAAGIIGTTIKDQFYPQGVIGNFGLVCLPFDSIARYQFEYATVITGGSKDVPVVAKNAPFNEYITRVLPHDPTTTRNRQQNFQMCPPGFYLKGLRYASSGRVMESVYALRCERWDKGESAIRMHRIGFGRESSSQQRLDSECAPGYFVDGINIRSGWYTDAFQLQCRKA